MAEATLIVSGGFKTAPPVIRCFDAQALENNQVVDALADEEGARALVGCGGTLLDQEIVIVNPEHMTRCAADEVGEIWVAGPSVAQGYWKRPGRNRAHVPRPSGGRRRARICAPATSASCKTASCSSPAGSKT